MTIAAFTWQRYKEPLPATASAWRRQEKIMVAKEETAPHPYAGMSVLDIVWQELDDVMDLLMEQGAPESSSLRADIEHRNYTAQEARELGDEWYNTLKEWGELRGQAQGLAFAIAVLTNPYAADVPAVKVEASARWARRNKR